MGYDYGYDYGYGYGSGIGGAFIAGWFIGIIALWVFVALIRWKIFQKAGEEGWKSIIPIYGDYIEWKMVWGGKWFWFSILAVFVSGIGFVIPLIGPTIAFAAMLFVMVINTLFYLQYAHAFGKDDGFGIGLLLVSFVFKLFIAFDSDIQFQSQQPDPKFFKKIKEESDNARAAMAEKRAEAVAKAEAAAEAARANRADDVVSTTAPDVVEITVDEVEKSDVE